MFLKSMLAETTSPLCHGPPAKEGTLEPADSKTAEGMSMFRVTGMAELESRRPL